MICYEQPQLTRYYLEKVDDTQDITDTLVKPYQDYGYICCYLPMTLFMRYLGIKNIHGSDVDHTIYNLLSKQPQPTCCYMKRDILMRQNITYCAKKVEEKQIAK